MRTNHNHNQHSRKQAEQEGREASINSMIASFWTTTFWSQRCARPFCFWLFAGRTNGTNKPSTSSLRALTLLWLVLCTSLVIKHRDLLSVFWSFCASFGLAAILSRRLLGVWFCVPPRRNNESASFKSSSPERSLSSSQGSTRSKNLVGIIACIVAWMHLDGKPYFWTFPSSSSSSSSSPEFTALSILAGYLAFDHWFAGLYCKRTPKSLGSVTEDALTLTGMLILLAAASSSSTTSAFVSSPSSPFSLGAFSWKGDVQLNQYSTWVRAWIVYKLLRLVIDLLWNRQNTASTDFSNNIVVSKKLLRRPMCQDKSGPSRKQSGAEAGASPSASAEREPKDSVVQLSGVVADSHPIASTEAHPDKVALPFSISSSSSVPTKTTISSSNYWIIHGRYYDLTGFVHRHPGGAEALLLARGRDGTALFESYHPFTRSQAQRVLNKFEVTCKLSSTLVSTQPTNVAASNSKDELSQSPDIFYQVLCQRVAKTLASKGIDPVMHRAATPLRAAYYLLILGGLVMSGVAHSRVRCHQ